MKNAEAYGCIPINNSGGRKGRTAIDVAMLKYLTIGTSHMIRKNCAITDYDTRACYDRILPHVLFLCYSKMGLPQNECVWLAKALVNIHYHILKGMDRRSDNHCVVDSAATPRALGFVPATPPNDSAHVTFSPSWL